MASFPSDMATADDYTEFRSLIGLIRKARQHSDEHVLAVIAGLSPAALNCTNRNGKGSLHFCAQIRESAELSAALVAARADINASTRRGHTALIYACGRGRDQTAQRLIQLGALTRVRTVGGVTAVSIAEGRVSAQTLQLLQQQEQTEEGEWRDFRGDADAIAAQREHDSRSWEKSTPVVAVETICSPEAVELLAANIRAAGPDQIAGLLVNASGTCELKSALTAACTDPTVLQTVLSGCRDRALGHAVSQTASGDRRPIRVVLAAIVGAADVMGCSSSEIELWCDTATAMELLAKRQQWQDGDDDVLWRLWCSALEESCSGFTPEVSRVLRRQLPKRAGGQPVSELLRLLYWAVAVQSAVGNQGLQRMLGQLATHAAQHKHAHKLLQAVKGAGTLPAMVVEVLAGLVPQPQPQPPTATAPDRCALASWNLESKYRWDWVDTEAQLEHVLRSLARHKVIGVDTEWDSNGRCAVCQVTVRDISCNCLN